MSARYGCIYVQAVEIYFFGPNQNNLMLDNLPLITSKVDISVLFLQVHDCTKNQVIYFQINVTLYLIFNLFTWLIQCGCQIGFDGPFSDHVTRRHSVRGRSKSISVITSYGIYSRAYFSAQKCVFMANKSAREKRRELFDDEVDRYISTAKVKTGTMVFLSNICSWV